MQENRVLRDNPALICCSWVVFLGLEALCHAYGACMQVTVDAERQNVREMASCDLVLDSNTAVVLDCGTHIFLWLGANIELPPNLSSAIRKRSLAALDSSTAGGAAAAALLQSPQSPAASGILNACVQVAHACAVGRVPVPELKVCLEGTGDERYVLSRLAPTDSMARGDLVLAQLPHLVELYDEDAAYAAAMVAHITRRLPKTDEPGFVAWAAQGGVDLRAALLREDPDIQKPSAGGAGSAGRRPGSAASSRPSSGRGGHVVGTTPANSTGDRADDLGLFNFLSRGPAHARQGVAGQSTDVEAGLGGGGSAGGHMRAGSAAAPPVTTIPPPSSHGPAREVYDAGGVHGAGGAITFAGIVPPVSTAATAPQTDAAGPGNNAQEPFRHSTLHTHGLHASPRSPVVPMPPRPPSLSTLPPGGRPGLSKPPLVPAGGPGSHMHAGYGKVASALSESASPPERNATGLQAVNLRGVHGLQSPEQPGATRDVHMHAGAHQKVGAPTSHPQMQMPTFL